MTICCKEYLARLQGDLVTGSDMTLVLALQDFLVADEPRPQRAFHTSEEEEISEPTYRQPLRTPKTLLKDDELPL